ncbi:MAG: PD40 domain-containing protein [Methanobacteriaceae archaeon]|nr:PD40 domain-containing protein [Methanobacteriaceae archaeon]
MKNKVLLLMLVLFLVLVTCGTIVAADNTTERISVSSDGSQSNAASSNPSISADGRYIAFTSYADNLVPGDTNGFSDIFIRDNVLNTTIRASVSNTGEEGNGDSNEPAISVDGRYVTFTSNANNLVPGDTNGVSDIFLRDILLGINKRISITNTGKESNGDSNEPAISADGRFIAFSSYATNLVPSDNNGKCDIFLYDNDSGQITRLTVSNTGNEANGNSEKPTINGDGSLIAFISSANNLVENTVNSYSGVYIYNRNSGILEKVNTSSFEGGFYNFNYPSISANGSYLVFTSGGNSLLIYNTSSKTIEQVEISWNGVPNSMTIEPSISADGRYVAVSSANHEISDTIDRWMDVYIYDQFSKTTKLISSSTGETSFYSSYQPSISADGHTVAFSSLSDVLISDDTNNCKDIFVYTENYPLTATINPDCTKSGDIVTIQVSPSPNIASVSATILDTSYSLIKGSNGFWILSYLVLSLANGFYPVELNVTDNAGNQRNISLGFTVDNTLPTISATITPDLVKSGDYISIDALTSSDTLKATALINGETFDLYQQTTGWNLSYLTPNIPDGTYTILLTATDKSGNQNTTILYFTVDNTPPVLSGSVTPGTAKTNDNLNINATSDSDTTSISALIINQTYDLIKQDDGTWILKYCVPYVSDGNYPILLTATDRAGNQNTLSLNFNLFNPLDNQAPIVSGNVTHCDMMYGELPTKPWIYFHVLTDSDVIGVTATVLGNVYILERQEDGSWAAEYSSWLTEGNYTVLLTAQDWSGNQGTQTVNFTVRNISPIINYTVTSKVKSRNNLIIIVHANPDPWKVTVSSPFGEIDLEKQANGSWTTNYTIPDTEDGYKNLYIKCLYEMNWFSWLLPNYTIMNLVRNTGFTVDNTPPIISVSATPNPIKSGDVIKISCISTSYFDPDDTSTITVNIFGQNLNLNWTSWTYSWSRNSGTWNAETIIPQLPDGTYSALVTANDDVGNQITEKINFTVDNTPPTITAIITPDRLKYIDFSRQNTSIIAESSPDAKEIHAYFEDGSEGLLGYSDNNWILQLNFPYLLPIGTYVINLKVFDYAGNEAQTSVNYYVYPNLSVKNPLIKPSESGSDSSNNNQPGDGSSITGSATGTSTQSTGSAAETSDDPNDGTPLLKFVLQVLLILGDACTIIFAIGFIAVLIWALLAVLTICGWILGIFLIFVVALIIAAIIIVVTLILYQYYYNLKRG